jgi:hypothetical protein
MPTPDHHSEYLSRALGALTPAGVARVDELLDQLAAAAGGREQLARFAAARRIEADLGRPVGYDEPADALGTPELDALLAGFKTIRDSEQLDDVTDWANAVIALLQDERERTG